jgi:hypothetical protein
MTLELSRVVSGSAGNNLGAGTDIVNFVPGKGRWIVSGTVRHSLIDGVTFAQGPTASVVVLFRIPNAPGATADFGPFVVDMLNSTDSFVLELGTATGAADTASGVIYAQRASSL